MTPLMPRPTYWLLLLALLALFALSGNVLYQLGIFYDSPGGNPLHKIHPSFYLLLLALLSWLLYQHALPQLYYLFSLRSHVVLVAAAFCLLAHDILLGRPLSSAIVSYISAAIFIVLLKALSLTRRLQLKQLLLLLLSLNALVGLYEYASGGLIAPLVLTDAASGYVIDTSEWGQVRSAGLLGHPLTSSMITGFYLVSYLARLLFARVQLTETLTAILLLCALPLFGGRGAILAAGLVIVLLLLLKAAQVIQRRQLSARALLYLLFSLLLLPMMAYLAYSIGLLEPVLSRLEDDQGSASTRLIALELMLDTSWLNLLFGDLDRSIGNKALLFGSRYGIEIGWIALMLTYGLLLSGLLLYALYINLRWLYYQLSPLLLFPWLYAVIAWTSGTGISGKTIMLSAALCMTLLLFSDDRHLKPPSRAHLI